MRQPASTPSRPFPVQETNKHLLIYRPWKTRSSGRWPSSTRRRQKKSGAVTEPDLRALAAGPETRENKSRSALLPGFPGDRSLELGRGGDGVEDRAVFADVVMHEVQPPVFFVALTEYSSMGVSLPVSGSLTRRRRGKLQVRIVSKTDLVETSRIAGIAFFRAVRRSIDADRGGTSSAAYMKSAAEPVVRLGNWSGNWSKVEKI
jgi:hypothetical protein